MANNPLDPEILHSIGLPTKDAILDDAKQVDKVIPDSWQKGIRGRIPTRFQQAFTHSMLINNLETVQKLNLELKNPQYTTNILKEVEQGKKSFARTDASKWAKDTLDAAKQTYASTGKWPITPAMREEMNKVLDLEDELLSFQERKKQTITEIRKRLEVIVQNDAIKNIIPNFKEIDIA